MALVPITHVYDTLSAINNTGLLDGQILYTTDQTVNKIFADVKVNNILRRIEIGGTNEIDTVLNQESGHAIANSAVAKLAQTVHTNLIDPTLGTTTINGITCTKNSDGTYTLTGTATELVTLDICTVDVVKGVSYRLVGCPSVGSSTTYRMGLYTNESNPSVITQDLGTGCNWVSDRTATLKIRIVVQPNYAISGSLVFKPMLTTDLSATYDDYVQYSGNGELNQNVADLYSNLTALDTKVGAQSLLPTPSQSVTQNINTLKTEINRINSDLSSMSGNVSQLTMNGLHSVYFNALSYNRLSVTFSVEYYFNFLCIMGNAIAIISGNGQPTTATSALVTKLQGDISTTLTNIVYIKESDHIGLYFDCSGTGTISLVTLMPVTSKIVMTPFHS